MGTNIRDWFVNVLANGKKGSADLVAYFFLRAMSLLNSQGNLGLIATNTVAQGDTREVGLKQMVARWVHDHPRYPEQVLAGLQRQPRVCGSLGHPWRSRTVRTASMLTTSP